MYKYILNWSSRHTQTIMGTFMNCVYIDTHTHTHAHARLMLIKTHSKNTDLIPVVYKDSTRSIYPSTETQKRHTQTRTFRSFPMQFGV